MNGLRPERATGTTIDADDTETAAKPESSTPNEMPSTAGRSCQAPITPSDTTETITTAGNAKVNNAAALPTRSSMPRTAEESCRANAVPSYEMTANSVSGSSPATIGGAR